MRQVVFRPEARQLLAPILHESTQMFNRILTDLATKIGYRLERNEFLGRLGYKKTILIRGVRVRCPISQGITFSPTEPWLVPILAALLPETSGTFVDVGVNLGQSLVKLRALDAERKYVGFEPNPFCVLYVRRLIEENRFRNCTIVPVALFTEDRLLPLDLYSESPADPAASLIEGFRPGENIYSRQFVPAFRFESVTRQLNIGSLGVVKIDAEGAELEIAKSLYQVILQDRPILLMEVLPVYSNDNAFRKNRQEEIERLLRDADYVIHRVQKAASDDFAGLTRVDGFGVHSDLTQCDYVLAPNEVTGRLQKTIRA